MSTTQLKPKIRKVDVALLSALRNGNTAKPSSLSIEEIKTLAFCLENSVLLRPVVSLLQKDLSDTVRRLGKEINRYKPGDKKKLENEKAKGQLKKDKVEASFKQLIKQLREKHSQQLKKYETIIKDLKTKQKETTNKLKAVTAQSIKGRPRCTAEGCYNVARGKSKKCIGHGGGPRCTYEGCNSGALSASVGLCGKHSVANGNNAIICAKCKKIFKSLEGLRSHTKNKVCERIVVVEPQEYRYACSSCSRRFKSSQGLAYHRKVFHEGIKIVRKRKLHQIQSLSEPIKESPLELDIVRTTEQVVT